MALWAVDNWVPWCHCCWLSLIFHFDWLGGVFLLFLCLTDRRGELFRMPAQVIIYAWLPVLRLKLTSILMIRNPHELLRKSWGEGVQVFWDYHGSLRKSTETLQQRPGADLSQVHRHSLCVLFYRVAALMSPLVKNFLPFPLICTTTTHEHTYWSFIQTACLHRLWKMVHPVLHLQIKRIIQPFALITACYVLLLGLIIGF